MYVCMHVFVCVCVLCVNLVVEIVLYKDTKILQYYYYYGYMFDPNDLFF